MDLGQTSRPRPEPEPFNDFEVRRKCTFCCGLRCALVAGGVLFAITFPCNLVMLRGRICEGRGLFGFLDRNLFLPLPFAAVAFTHQVMQSEALWSKNRKPIWKLNWQCAGLNLLLWSILLSTGTFISRRFAPHWSRRYRLLLWEYKRTRRNCANKYFPTAFGRITEDLDWYNILWMLTIYHSLWGMITIMAEREFGAHYAMFYRDWPYSRWCSPRWREWREIEAIKHVNKEQIVGAYRWGSFLTSDRWRSSSV
ncbi:uncharacterized protein TM35_000032030 [Trypanosoma theileri]|uniref:Uncharacterized protein n=1 Tax=Trypanosoma theileri TaxID=67003 RepID=A0A1X0P7P1_9TRYP|nr:uncharacterized protein TM35_000032030 [Trypanosoma theileri]ORC92450.1 hypothetical protein TM35_000032030 [Trypanosoma theileri]